MNKLIKKIRNKRSCNSVEVITNPLFFFETCKFCNDHSTFKDNLYSCCNCKGTIKWCHISCLNEWKKHKYSNKNICEICNSEYKVPKNAFNKTINEIINENIAII